MNKITTPGGDIKTANTHGVFANSYNINGSSNTWCYLFGDKNKPCPSPPPHIGFKPSKMPDRFSNAAAPSPSAPSAPSTNNNDTHDTSSSTNAKTPARGGDQSTTTTVTPAPNNTSTTPKQSAADIIANYTFFHSGKAWALVMPKEEKKSEYTDAE